MKRSLPITQFLVLCALSACFAASATRAAHVQHENQSYLPFPRSAVGPQFRMKPLGSLREWDASRAVPIGASPATMRVDDSQIVLAGADRGGRPWSVVAGDYSCAGLAAELFLADLDRNGLTDLVVLAPTCGNGLAPSAHLVTLMFDRGGRPVPFEADGYFERLAEGLFDVADLNGDGRADLVYMNYDDGYWITNVYTAGDGRWVRVRGRFGRYTYPRFTRFTNRPNRRATTPTGGRRPFAPDLSQHLPVASGRLTSYEWANVAQSEDVVLNLASSSGHVARLAPVSWYSTFAVVVDGPSGRRIAMLSAEEASVRSLLDEIVEKRYQVTAYGRRRVDAASPELLWARAGR